MKGPELDSVFAEVPVNTIKVSTPKEVDEDDAEWEQVKEKTKDSVACQLYLVTALLLCIAEIILVSYDPNERNGIFWAQVIVLAVSSFLFVLGVHFIILFRERPKNNVLDYVAEALELALMNEPAIEFYCLAIGWACIFLSPGSGQGLAALRCFRIFRYVLFADFIDPEKHLTLKGALEWIPLGWLRLIHMQISKVDGYFDALYVELVTPQSKGSLVVLAMFFFTTYVFGVVFWVEVNAGTGMCPPGSNTTCANPDTVCGDLPDCFVTMMRLALYDGNGLGLLQDVMSGTNGIPGRRGLAALLILYMCATAMVLLNGLIGIFGAAFQADTTDETLEEIEKKMDNLDQRLTEMQTKMDRLLMNTQAYQGEVAHHSNGFLQSNDHSMSSNVLHEILTTVKNLEHQLHRGMQ